MDNGHQTKDPLHPLDAWHAVVKRRDAKAIDALLADDVVFHSPVVHTPQRGRKITGMYLTAALAVLVNDTFTYTREIRGDRDAVLEFTTTIDGIEINGVDLVHWDDEGHIDDFKVMLRPVQAVNLVHRLMGELLAGSRPRTQG